MVSRLACGRLAADPSVCVAIQDMLEAALTANGCSQSYMRCDSSDCLVCQGQRTFCSEAVTSHVCSWLERRMSATNSSIADSMSASVPSEDGTPDQRQHKRLRRDGSPDSADCLTGLTPSHAAVSQQQDEQCCSLLLQHGAQPWAWRPEWADRQQPAPCRMVELAVLQSPSELCGTGQFARRGDMICGLEFSVDGQLLATAGVSKQVGGAEAAATRRLSLWLCHALEHCINCQG